MAGPVRCKDCPAGSKRPTPHPGPRCATHHRARKAMTRAVAHEKYVGQVYSLTPGQYAALYAYQGGKCAICQRATGVRKRLAVDHDHSCCNGPTSCGRCVRGLLCGTCNKILGHLRDDPAAFIRGWTYLLAWPSRHAFSSTGSAPNASASATSRSARPGSNAAGAPATASSRSKT